MFNEQRSVTIRLASQDDAKQIAHLCEQLGYSVSAEHLSLRMSTLLPQSNHALFVAERAGELLLGWVHIYCCHFSHAFSRHVRSMPFARVSLACERPLVPSQMQQSKKGPAHLELGDSHAAN